MRGGLDNCLTMHVAGVLHLTVSLWPVKMPAHLPSAQSRMVLSPEPDKRRAPGPGRAARHSTAPSCPSSVCTHCSPCHTRMVLRHNLCASHCLPSCIKEKLPFALMPEALGLSLLCCSSLKHRMRDLCSTSTVCQNKSIQGEAGFRRSTADSKPLDQAIFSR